MRELKTSSSLVSPLTYTTDYLAVLPETPGYAETRPGQHNLASARALHRNGREVVEVVLSRPLVKILADLQTACLRAGKRAKKAAGRGDYHSRSMAGMAGELALHFFAKMLGLPARLMLPSLAPQPVDHLITIQSQELAIQSKTCTLRANQIVNTIYGRFKFFVDANDTGLEYYSFAMALDDELSVDTSCITVYLFAFVPIWFVQQHAVADRGRYITYEQLQAANETFSHAMFDHERILPRSIFIPDETYQALTSPNIDDRLLEALILVDSPRDASRALDMLTNDPDLRKALEAVNPRLVAPRLAVIPTHHSSNCCA